MSYNEQIAKDLTLKMGADIGDLLQRHMNIMITIMPLEQVLQCISIGLVVSVQSHIDIINDLTGHKMDAENKAMVMDLFNS